MISTPQEPYKTSLTSDIADCIATLRERYGLLEFYPPNASFVVLYKDRALARYLYTLFAPAKKLEFTFAKLDSSSAKHAQKLPQNFPIILAQTDTTIGFLSLSPHALNLAKHRPINQAVLITFASLQCAKQTHRVPRIHRHFVRQASKISIILSNKKSFRIVKEPLHREFLRYFGGLYSTSANRTKESFSLEFALQVADIIALDSRGLYEDKPSVIYRLSRTRKKCARA